MAHTDTYEQASVMACPGEGTHATLTRNTQSQQRALQATRQFFFTRTYPSQGLNLKQAAEGADNMSDISHRTCPIGPMAPGIKDSSPRAGGWDKNYKACSSCKQCYGTCSLPPTSNLYITAGRGRIQQRLIWKDGISADSRPVTQSLPETYKELLILSTAYVHRCTDTTFRAYSAQPTKQTCQKSLISTRFGSAQQEALQVVLFAPAQKSLGGRRQRRPTVFEGGEGGCRNH